jgi:subtilase family serine protease
MRVPRLMAVAAGSCGLIAAVAAGPGTDVSRSLAARPAATGPARSSDFALADVAVRPGVQRAGRAQANPPTTADCEKAYKVACYQPSQIRQAYDLAPVYASGVTGRGTTIVIVDSFGSPTIRNDLSVFDRAFGLPAPPRLTIIQPAGTVPGYDPNNSDMVGWAGETTLDVEYAHTIAPGASILLVETPVSETEGVHGFPQIVAAEEYVIRHHLGDVISQSFSATE